jgi:hypothetical protein
MGGYGSGRRASRPTLNQCRRITIRALRASIRHSGGRALIQWADGAKILFKTSRAAITPCGASEQPLHAPITLAWDRCPLGGARPYFVCPQCQRRAQHLFPQYGFACRHCTGLIYRSQTSTEVESLFDSLARVQRQLVKPPTRLSDYAPYDIPEKPKGMWRSTYSRLIKRLLDLQTRQQSAFQRQLKIVPLINS